jgi:cell wall-associated NlpC family hydrolase
VTPADPTLVVAAARRWLGTPYHDQASVIGVGCDCLGLARGVWRVGHVPIRSLIAEVNPRWEAGARRY